MMNLLDKTVVINGNTVMYLEDVKELLDEAKKCRCDFCKSQKRIMKEVFDKVRKRKMNKEGTE